MASKLKFLSFVLIFITGAFILFTLTNTSELETLRKLEENDKNIIYSESLHSNGQLQLAKIFDHHMVLQREPKKSSIWGWCALNQSVCSVKVRLDQFTFQAQILPKQKLGNDALLKWKVEFPPQKAGGPHTIRINDDSQNYLKVEDVYFGDVFNCVGQSNMLFTIKQTFKEREKEENFEFPEIRVFSVGRKESFHKENEFPSPSELSWQRSSKDLFLNEENEPWTYFSATCWYFGKALHQELKIPIGLISKAVNGSPLQVCISSLLHFLVQNLSLTFKLRSRVSLSNDKVFIFPF